ncbi:hypothetical protein AVEN_107107-1 [Araneus ventricosus]|uniref:Uncharacterized protein n=1 Tax=Araneus ventricosus TaxID=182803 RepID=A0A4Y2G6A9_ARAVE|nr:hypothetical protein AVEN_107107-1 [Araneus ventricosus]
MFVITTSQQTCFASGLVDYALLLYRKFVAKLSRQVCPDKIISRKIKLAASVHAIWEYGMEGQKNELGFFEAPVCVWRALGKEKVCGSQCGTLNLLKQGL